MNTITLLGRATAQIELKQTQAGKAVVSFSLAVKRPFTKDVTDFFTIVAWDKQAELLSKYVKKGDQICIRGYLTNRSWTDNNGNKRYATEVVADEISFVGNKDSAEAKSEPSTYMPEAYKTQPNFEDITESEGFPF